MRQFNIPKLASNQLVLNNNGSLGWGDSCGGILLTVLCLCYASKPLADNMVYLKQLGVCSDRNEYSIWTKDSEELT